jgi:hypothetical protein
VALAVQAHAGHSFHFWRRARKEEELRAPARKILEEVGLGARADVIAANLAHGEQRQLEIAWRLRRAPASAARRAGGRHGYRGIAAHGAVPRHAQGRRTMILVEHDMDAVFSLPTGSRCSSTAASSRPERRRKSARTPKCAPRTSGGQLMLRVANLETAYGVSQVLFGVTFAIGPARS